jgi:hypothetical protein
LKPKPVTFNGHLFFMPKDEILAKTCAMIRDSVYMKSKYQKRYVNKHRKYMANMSTVNIIRQGRPGDDQSS